MTLDEAHRALVREAEHGHDAALWLRAGSALARAGEHDHAGRALLRARALGAETGPVDDALAPAALDFVRRGVGALLTDGSLSHMAWGPRSDTIYAVTQDRTVLALGVEPGQNRRVKDVGQHLIGVGATLDDSKIVVVARELDFASFALLDVETKSLTPLGGTPRADGYSIQAFSETEVWARAGTRGLRFVKARPGRCEPLSLHDAALTWLGEVVRPAPPAPGAPRTLRMVFSEEQLRLSFPTRRSVDRFCAEATIDAIGLAPHEVRSTIRCIAAAPSGRHVAFVGATNIRLVDFQTGENKVYELEGPPLDASWSPSGRRLAVLTAPRVHVLSFSI